MLEKGLYLIGLISFLGIAQTYILYPLSLFLFGKKRQAKPALSTNFDIAVVIAAFNEENVIEKKIQSVLATSYPLDKLVIYVGSDASTDRTNEIVANFGAHCANVLMSLCSKYPRRKSCISVKNQHPRSLVDYLFVNILCSTTKY